MFAAAAIFYVAYVVPGWWLPRNVSTFGGVLDDLFYLIFWITAFFFILTEAILVYNIWAFGNPEPGRKPPYVRGNHKLELTWTIVPSIVLVFIAVVQLGAWVEIKYPGHMPSPKRDGERFKEVQQMVVVARQWEWRVRYPSPKEYRSWDSDPSRAEKWYVMAEYAWDDLSQMDDVHVPNEVHCYSRNAAQPSAKVLVHLKTRDVLHSFFLPHMRLKQDAVPGKVIPVWFEATDYNVETKPTGDWDYRQNNGDTRPWEWDLACAEFCGSRHSMMRGRLIIHKDRDAFLRWLERAEREQKLGKFKEDGEKIKNR
jgi:cytochrome c oxidase subunit 2